jgi:hypothetical protein
MRICLLSALLIFSTLGFGQLKNLNLTNALVVGQLDKPEDRYTMEINLTELLITHGVKSMASLNILKQGASPAVLSTDSIAQLLKAKGIDTYVLVSVRGYDRKFKPAVKHDSLTAELANGHLFPLYRDEIVSITLEFNFYRNGQFVAYDMVKLGGIGSREAVLKKFRKKVSKRISAWK